MVNRRKYNFKIIVELIKIMIKRPELRFCQILSILELDRDNFYEEPDKTLSRIRSSVSRWA